MELSKAYMQGLSLNKISFLKYYSLLFITAITMNCCENATNRKPTISNKTSQKTIKKTAKKETLTKVKKQILVQDVISDKNVRSFFIDYGKKNPETKLILKTRLGNISIQLFKETPLHRASFIYLIKNGYYNKTCFHRIVKDFIIQGGWSDQNIVQEYRSQLNNYRIPPEFKKELIHQKGALSATRRWVENPGKLSNPFEFFIMQTSLDCSHLNFEHTVFGQVTNGLEVVDKISKVTLDEDSEWPEVDINIEFEILP